MEQLITRWGRQLDTSSPLTEYPRPRLRRDSCLNLNGTWEYSIGTKHGEILVPFSPECKLSGVEEILRPGQVLHYRKAFTLPEGFLRDRLILHFGAVDQECTVYVNGTEVGRHVGGYLAFSFDITQCLCTGENVIELDVVDATEYAPHARGKQKLDKLKGRMSYLFYTPQSGIWKTVWLESVPRQYIRDLEITPDFDNGSVLIEPEGDMGGMDMTITVRDGETVLCQYDGPAKAQVSLMLDSFTPWTPETPKLYDVTVKMGEDTVESYFGMRKVSVGRDKNGILRFFLNNKPYFFNGVLDQGYWPESLLTPPSDEALQYDIVKLKEMGFNTIRKHIKIESERFYYHCDRLGMLVWQDMPNGGSAYNMVFVTYLPTVSLWCQRHMPDCLYRLFSRENAEGRAQYYRDLEGMIRQLRNHPCIAEWTAFNEGWGQFDASEATRRIRALDPTRLINEACGWYDRGGGDMYSIHNYFRKLRVKPKKDRVVALTEFGGYAYEVPGHVACEKKVGYQSYESPEALTESLSKLWAEHLMPNLKTGLCAAIYTQTSDIEEEINGLMTYDREIAKFPIEKVAELNRKLYEEFDRIVNNS